MSPTECFKNHGIPFRREEKKPHRRRIKETRLMRSSPSTSPVPHEQLAHPGAPRLGATATTASWSRLSRERKTPWW